MGRLYWRDVGLAMGSFLAITCILCVGYDFRRTRGPRARRTRADAAKATSAKMKLVQPGKDDYGN
ncbi:MAG: hypothetical protein HY323_18225 [Betaproteobacteria bacterium]|nr:hypothetical protein [Betaproteobacteria bacterium]